MSDAQPVVAFALAAAVLTAVTLAFVLRPIFREHRRIIVAAIATVLLAAPSLYATLGGGKVIGDDRRADAATATSTRPIADLREDLVVHLDRNPRDARGWVLLARLELGEDRFEQSAAAYAHALDNPKAASDTALWCEYADALALAQGGRLAGRPRAIIGEALARNPRHPQALEMAGSAALETGEYALAVAYWRMLLEALPEGSSERLELGAAVARVDLLAAGAAGPNLR